MKLKPASLFHIGNRLDIAHLTVSSTTVFHMTETYRKCSYWTTAQQPSIIKKAPGTRRNLTKLTMRWQNIITSLLPARVRKPKDKPNAEGLIGVISTVIKIGSCPRNSLILSLMLAIL